MRSAVSSSERGQLIWAAAVGAALGASAYVRAVSDVVGWLMLALLVVWGILTVLHHATEQDGA